MCPDCAYLHYMHHKTTSRLLLLKHSKMTFGGLKASRDRSCVEKGTLLDDLDAAFCIRSIYSVQDILKISIEGR